MLSRLYGGPEFPNPDVNKSWYVNLAFWKTFYFVYITLKFIDIKLEVYRFQKA